MRPCIVVGVETQIGLAVVRELGRAGVPVIAVAQGPRALGFASRHVMRRVVVPQPRSDELIDALNALAREHGTCCLMAISEANLGWLIEQRHRLVDVIPILPNRDALAIVLDKGRTLEAASEVGIAVPPSAEPRSMQDAEAIAQRMPFPAVLKWKDPAAVAPRLAARGIELLKAEHVQDAGEFLAAARRYEALGVWPLVQGYCPGQGFGQFFFMHKGEAVRRFQHLRVAEWPPEGGYSSVCDDVPLTQQAPLQEQSIALLRRIGWEGLAMVEYRLDPVTQRACLMEINGRFWGSFPLAVQSRAGFALLAYSLQGCGVMPPLEPLKRRQRCRSFVTELKRLHRIWLQPERIHDRQFKLQPVRELARFAVDYVRPGVGYFVWSWTDPGPFLSELRAVALKLCRRLRPTALQGR